MQITKRPSRILTQEPTSAGSEMRNRPIYAGAKRVMDASLAIVALALLSPLFVAISVLVRRGSPGPAFFRQKRLGKDRKEFTFLKFRSMYADADQRVHERIFERYAKGLAAEDSEDATRFKPADDPRVTRVGKWLRKTSLDELPQLFNVLAGDMSLVGPRPAIGYELEHYEDWQLGRFGVIPGITGVWQVYGRSSVTFEQMMEMDAEYVRSRSLWLDIKLLILTVPMILTRRGGH